MIGPLAMFLALVVPPNPAQDTPKPADPLTAFEGVWTSTDESGESTWTFLGEKLSLVTPSREYKITIKLGKDGETQTIDLAATSESPNAAGYKAPGIYKFEGGKLFICFGDDQSGRPKEFVNNFPSTFLFELKKK